MMKTQSTCRYLCLFIFLCTLAFTLSSCSLLSLMFDDPQTGEDAYKNKTTMKSFADVEDPIVLNLPLVIQESAFGGSMKGDTYHPSSIHIVYDWKNGKVHDWCYVYHSYFSGCNPFPTELQYEDKHWYSYQDANLIQTTDIFTDGTYRNTYNVSFGFYSGYSGTLPFYSPLARAPYTSPYIPVVKHYDYEDHSMFRKICIYDWRTWEEVCIVDDTYLDNINRYALDADNNLYIEYGISADAPVYSVTKYCRFDFATKQCTSVTKEEAEKYLTSMYVDGTKIAVASSPVDYNSPNVDLETNTVTYTFTIDDGTEKKLNVTEVAQYDSMLLNVEKVDGTIYALLRSQKYGYLLLNLSNASANTTVSSANGIDTDNVVTVLSYSKIPERFGTAYFRGDAVYFMVTVYDGEEATDTMYWTECYCYNIKTGDIKNMSFKLNTLL